MARQSSPIKFHGEVGDFSYYKSRKGYLAREKSGVTGERMQKDPAFKKTLQHGAEFGRACSAGKALRDAFRKFIQKKADGGVSSRLAAAMLRVVQSDPVNPRGLRNVIDGDLGLLKGFEFNQLGTLSNTLAVHPVALIDRATGRLSVVIPAFQPAVELTAPEGTTHFKLMASGAEVDFAGGDPVVRIVSTEFIQLGTQEQGVITLEVNLPPASTGALFLMFGIEFFDLLNGQYDLNSAKVNTLKLMAVEDGV